MYRFLDHLTPDDVEAIAALAFVEMQEAGFAAVAEFHYLHHAPGGAPYADPAETRRAASSPPRPTTGIGLTLLPVFYAFGGAGAPPARRRPAAASAATSTASPASLDATRAAARALPADARLGVAPHSLRAVDARRRSRRCSPRTPTARSTSTPPNSPRRSPTSRPGSARARSTGCSPTTGVDPRWCLIHATQMTAR